jgi:hypothetical protein
MHVQDHVAVVGDDAVAPHGLSAERHQFARDVAARHRDHLDGQRERAQHRHLLGRIDDADELAAGRGDDLFARERRAAALDEAIARVALVGAVHVQRQRADGVEVEHVDAAFLEQLRALLGTRYRALDAVAFAAQRLDEPAHGGAGADADDVAVHDVTHRALGGEAFLFFAGVGHVIPGRG